jgi:hypothetical protein
MIIRKGEKLKEKRRKRKEEEHSGRKEGKKIRSRENEKMINHINLLFPWRFRTCLTQATDIV